MNSIMYFEVQHPVELSDHSAICCEIILGKSLESKQLLDDYTSRCRDLQSSAARGKHGSQDRKYNMNKDNISSLIDNFNSEGVVQSFERLLLSIQDLGQDTDGMVSLLNDVCASLLNKFRMHQHTSMRKTFPRNKWFDDDCKRARREVRIAGRDVHKSLHHRTHF